MIARAHTRVLVTHGGSNPLAYQLLACLAELGWDWRFETGFYDRRDPAVRAALALLPGALRARVERELSRRRREGLDPARVGIHPWPEFVHVAVKRLGLPQSWRAGRALARGYALDRQVARRLGRLAPAVVVSYDSFALETFREARRRRIPTVLNQCTGHLAEALAIYRQEAAVHPEFADSLGTDAPDEIVARCTEEARIAGRVLAPSAYVRDTLLRHGVEDGRIVLLPYGVDSRRFHPAPRAPDGRIRLLYVGQIGQKKGIKYLLEAVKALARPEIELVLVGAVVGGGRGLAPYRGLYRHVPHLPYAEVHRAFAEADIFVYPSLHEGMPFAVLEAMASGLPVVTTANAGSPVEDGRDGFVVPIRSVPALAGALGRLADDASLRAAMGRAGRAAAEGLGWDRYRAGLDRVLVELAKGEAAAEP